MLSPNIYIKIYEAMDIFIDKGILSQCIKFSESTLEISYNYYEYTSIKQKKENIVQNIGKLSY